MRRCRRLARAEVLAIRRRYAQGATMEALATLYRRDLRTVAGIVRGRTWREAGGRVAEPDEPANPAILTAYRHLAERGRLLAYLGAKYRGKARSWHPATL